MHVVKSHGDQEVVFALMTTSKHRLLRLVYVGIVSHKGGWLRKFLETKVEMFPQNKNSGFSLLNLY